MKTQKTIAIALVALSITASNITASGGHKLGEHCRLATTDLNNDNDLKLGMIIAAPYTETDEFNNEYLVQSAVGLIEHIDTDNRTCYIGFPELKKVSFDNISIIDENLILGKFSRHTGKKSTPRKNAVMKVDGRVGVIEQKLVDGTWKVRIKNGVESNASAIYDPTQVEFSSILPATRKKRRHALTPLEAQKLITEWQAENK